MQIKNPLIAFALGLGLTFALVWLLGGGWLPVARAATISNVVENDGINPADGQCTLREAINNVNGDSDTTGGDCAAGDGDDTIVLRAYTYVLTMTGTGDDANLTGDLDITDADALTITGAGPGQTVIDASGAISDRVFDIQVSAGTVVISGVTIINGNVTGQGGGIRSRAADLTLINVEVISNAASVSGGGVYAAQGSVTLSGGQVLSNTAGSMGGGVFAQECSAALGGTRVVSNTAGDGGGVYILSGSATLSGGQILSNSADYGGGVCVAGFGAAGDGVFTQTGDSVIAYNTATNRGGGVYVNDEDSSATLSGGQVFSNTAGDFGGGVYVWQGSVTLNEAQILCNSADSGGGLYAYDGSTTLNGGQVFSNTASLWGGGVDIGQGSATLNGIQVFSNTASQWGGGGLRISGAASVSLVNAAVHGNTTGRDGGGLYVGAGTVSLSLANATISRNQAGSDGGGLYVDSGTITMTYTTIASNTASAGGGGIHREGGVIALQNTVVAYNDSDNCAGAPTSNGHNLDSGTTCGLTATGDITGTDPLLGPLVEENGTWAHPLLAGSPAIDEGLCLPGVTTVDQRGVPRPQGDGCDIGAYEFLVAPTGVTVGGPTEGTVGERYTFTATVSPFTATAPFTYAWSPMPEGGPGPDVVTYSWTTPGTKTITVTVENAGGAATGTRDVVIADHKIYLPLVLRN